MIRFIILLLFIVSSTLATAQVPPKSHPKTKKRGWQDLFTPDLSNAIKPANIWSFENGTLTATEDINIWSNKEYQDFILDLEFKTANGTNSGVIVHCSDISN